MSTGLIKHYGAWLRRAVVGWGFLLEPKVAEGEASDIWKIEELFRILDAAESVAPGIHHSWPR